VVDPLFLDPLVSSSAYVSTSSRSLTLELHLFSRPYKRFHTHSLLRLVQLHGPLLSLPSSSCRSIFMPISCAPFLLCIRSFLKHANMKPDMNITWPFPLSFTPPNSRFRGDRLLVLPNDHHQFAHLRSSYPLPTDALEDPHHLPLPYRHRLRHSARYYEVQLVRPSPASARILSLSLLAPLPALYCLARLGRRADP
jgi:hypothetical protein